MLVTGKVTGVKAAARAMKVYKKRMERKLMEVLGEEAMKVLEYGQAHVPVDEGKLKATGRIEPVKGGYAIKYGDSQVYYAKIIVGKDFDLWWLPFLPDISKRLQRKLKKEAEKLKR